MPISTTTTTRSSTTTVDVQKTLRYIPNPKDLKGYIEIRCVQQANGHWWFANVDVGRAIRAKQPADELNKVRHQFYAQWKVVDFEKRIQFGTFGPTLLFLSENALSHYFAYATKHHNQAVVRRFISFVEASTSWKMDPAMMEHDDVDAKIELIQKVCHRFRFDHDFRVRQSGKKDICIDLYEPTTRLAIDYDDGDEEDWTEDVRRLIPGVRIIRHIKNDDIHRVIGDVLHYIYKPHEVPPPKPALSTVKKMMATRASIVPKAGVAKK